MSEYFFELLTEEIPPWMHDAAQATARSRTRLITATRSVTETAPRASRVLNMCEHFSVQSYAGRTSFSSRQCLASFS